MRRFFLENHSYHTISVTHSRKPVFADPVNAEAVLNALRYVRKDKAFVLAYCLLPDHLHLVVVPKAGFEISQVMQSIKGFSSRSINERLGQRGRLWQPSYYDRIIRNDDHIREVVEYVHANPVQAGIVSKSEDFPFCSAHPDAETDIEAWMDNDRG
ncbi:MAG TPA: transposase [Dehalococcoidia bacterium]|nr:transposase [Dehalococcoidia bacterium]